MKSICLLKKVEKNDGYIIQHNYLFMDNDDPF